MTIPRELKLKHVGKEIFITQQPVAELNTIQSKPVVLQNVKVTNSLELAASVSKIALPVRLDLALVQAKDLSVILSNNAGEQVVIGYDSQKKEYFIDRTKSGNISFQKDFAGRHVAPRISDSGNINCSLIIDVSSVELFADDGLTGMTEVFFPTSPFNNIRIESAEGSIKKLSYSKLRSIWLSNNTKK